MQPFFNPKYGKAYLIAYSIDGDNLKGLLLHEIGVHALRFEPNQKDFKVILDQVEALRGTNEAVAKAFAHVAKDSPETDIAHEVVAYLIQHHPKLSISQKIS